MYTKKQKDIIEALVAYDEQCEVEYNKSKLKKSLELKIIFGVLYCFAFIIFFPISCVILIRSIGKNFDAYVGSPYEVLTFLFIVLYSMSFVYFHFHNNKNIAKLENLEK